MRGAVLVCAAIVAAAAGCTDSGPERTPEAATTSARQVAPEGVNINVVTETSELIMAAGYSGTLSLSDDGCVYLRVPDPAGPQIEVDLVWPLDTTLVEAADGTVEVVDKDGVIAGVVGERLSVGGGGANPTLLATTDIRCRVDPNAEIFLIQGPQPALKPG